MNLKDVDTSKFLENPKRTGFIKRMRERSSAFDFKIDGVMTSKLMTYLMLAYDKNSHFRRDISNFLKRKYEAGLAAGFELNDNNEFSKEVEDCMLGVNDAFNKAIVQYAAMQYDLDYAKLIVYELNYYKLIQDSFKKWDLKGDMKKQLDAISAEITELEHKLFGGEESINLRRALYEGTSQTRLRIRPEEMMDEYAINKLQYLSPWGNHKLEIANVVKFVGDRQPRI